MSEEDMANTNSRSALLDTFREYVWKRQERFEGCAFAKMRTAIFPRIEIALVQAILVCNSVVFFKDRDQ